MFCFLVSYKLVELFLFFLDLFLHLLFFFFTELGTYLFSETPFEVVADHILAFLLFLIFDELVQFFKLVLLTR